MAESLKDVIAKLKAQQNFQISAKPVETQNQVRREIPQRVKPVEKPVEVEEDLSDLEDEYDEDDEEIEETPIAKGENQAKASESNSEEIKRIQETISSLHDNGIFRLELLNNFQEINKNLTIITGILLELSGYGKEKTGN